MNKLLAAAAVSIISLIGVAATSEAEGAQARCGTTIRGKVKLTQDLDCTGQKSPRLLGPKAHLDLNGHTLTCGLEGTVNRLKMLGQGTLLRNGELRECTIQLLNGGRHRVRDVSNNTYINLALEILSSSNEVSYSYLGSDEQAVSLTGSYNVLSDNTVFGEVSPMILFGDRNILVHNVFSVSADWGPALTISGSLNRVYGNRTSEGCIFADSLGTDNIIVANDEPEDFCPDSPY